MGRQLKLPPASSGNLIRAAVEGVGAITGRPAVADFRRPPPRLSQTTVIRRLRGAGAARRALPRLLNNCDISNSTRAQLQPRPPVTKQQLLLPPQLPQLTGSTRVPASMSETLPIVSLQRHRICEVFRQQPQAARPWPRQPHLLAAAAAAVHHSYLQLPMHRPTCTDHL